MSPNKALWVILITAVIFRLVLVLTHDNHLGVDGGAYLLSRNAVLGDEPTGAGFPRPPLAPGWHLVPFTALLGDDVGYKVWAAIASMAPLGAALLIGRMFLRPWSALAVVALIAFDPLHGEMMVTGALPLLGFSLIGLAMWAMAKLHDPTTFQWRHVVVLTLSIPLIAHVNQTSSGIALIVLPLYLLALGATTTVSRATGEHGLNLVQRIASAPLAQLPASLSLIAGGLLALTALPWYIAIRPNSEILHYPGPWIYVAPFSDAAWVFPFIGIPVGIWVLLRASAPSLRALGVIVIVLTVLQLLWSTDESILNVFYRSQYMLMLGLYPAIGWLVVRYWPEDYRQLMAPATAVLVVSWGGMYQWQFHNQAGYSDMVTTESAEALELLREEPAGGVVSNAFTLSLWVAALNRVPSPHVWTWEPPRAYTETDRQVRCVLGWVDGCDWQGSAQELEVSHVLVDERFPNYNGRAPDNYMAPPEQWTVTAAAPWLDLVYHQGTTKLWRIKQW